MARPFRFKIAGGTYHVYCRGERKDPIFFGDHDNLVFIRKLGESLLKYDCICYTYCLMPNHFHLYMKTLRPNISEAIHHLNSAYSNWIKAKHGIIGHVFQGRFGSVLVEDAAYAVFLSSYIHLNPVRAKICRLPGEYRWSSYELVCGRQDPAFRNFDRSFVLGFLHPDPEAAVPLYERYVREMMRNPKAGRPPVRQRAFMGSEAFAKDIRARFNIESDRKEIPCILRRVPAGPTHESIRSVVRDVLLARSTVVAGGMSRADAGGERTGKAGKIEKKIAIYLETRHMSQSLVEIGKRWGMDYRAVAQLAHRLEVQRGTDESLAAALREMEARLIGPLPGEAG